MSLSPTQEAAFFDDADGLVETANANAAANAA